MTPVDVRSRSAVAERFLEVAELVMDEETAAELPRVVGSLAVLAGSPPATRSAATRSGAVRRERTTNRPSPS